jgi:hypothetical protein
MHTLPQVYEDNKELLRAKISNAKALHSAVNDSKARISELKV